MQNIGADNAGDAFYRYKMPKLVAKIEGRGNGIKTNVVNNVEIAKALARPPGYVIKYFGCELGAQTKYEEELGTSIVNGAHDQKKLSELLEGFIKKYVQCYDCGNPETTIKIKKEDITLKCKACGAVSKIDPRHKLNTYILKNPPENKLSKEEKRLKKVEEERLDGAMQAPDAGTKDKKDKKKDKEGKEGKEKKDKKKKKGDEKDDKDKKADASPQDEDEDESEEEADDGVVWMTDTSAEAVRKRAEEQLSNATAALVSVVDVEAEEEDRRQKEAAAAKQAQEAEAEQRRQEEEAAAAEALARQVTVVTLDDIPADRVDTARAIQLLRGFPLSDPATLAQAVRKLNVEGGLAGKMRALYEALLTAVDGYMYLQMKAMLPVFAEFAGDAQGQLAQLIALEHLLAEVVPEKQKETAKLLETMYKDDLADSDIIIAWYEKEDAAKILGVGAEGAAAVRAAAKPVYEFLQEQEDDSDDDDDE